MINETNKLANSNVSGIDTFPSKNVKLSCNFIYKRLTYTCNLSFFDAIVPRSLEVSKVIPVFKKGSRCVSGNYRPISLMNVFNKILDKINIEEVFRLSG